MIVEVALALLWARLLCLLPMRTWVRLAGLRIAAAAPPIDAADAELGALVRCLRGVARRAPWRANCLPQAIAAMQLLRRRGYRPVMYLGARRLHLRPQPPLRRIFMRQHKPRDRHPLTSDQTSSPPHPAKDTIRPLSPAQGCAKFERHTTNRSMRTETNVFRSNKVAGLTSTNRRTRNKKGRRQHDAFEIELCF